MHSTDKSSNPTVNKKKHLIDLLMRERGHRLTKVAEISRRDKSDEIIPLSLDQEGLWFLNQMFPDKAYGIPGCVRIQGVLDANAFRSSLDAIIERHDILRTTLSSKDGKPVQLISKANNFSLQFTDFENIPAASRMIQARRIAKLDAEMPFNFEEGALIRGKLLRLAADDHVFLINLHHIIADGWSMSVLMDELDHFYSQALRKEPGELTELTVQYADYSIWQRKRLRGMHLDRLLHFWEKHLAGASTIYSLNADESPNDRQEKNAGHQPITIPEQVSDAARELARQSNVTLFVVLCSAFQCFIDYHSRQSDVVIGSSFANRQHPELEDLIGLFVHTLPMRTSLVGNPSMRELLRRTQTSVLEVHEHQELPLQKIVQHLRPERSMDRNPFFQVVFDLLTPDRNPAVLGYGLGSQADEQRRIGDLNVTPVEVDGSDARFDLAMFLWDLPTNITGVFEYDKNRFSPTSVKKWLRQYQAILELIVKLPDLTLQELYQQIDEVERKYSQRQTNQHHDRAREKLRLAKRKAVALTPSKAKTSEPSHRGANETPTGSGGEEK